MTVVKHSFHFHILFLDGVYVERVDGWVRFRWAKTPTRDKLVHLADSLAHCIGNVQKMEIGLR